MRDDARWVRWRAYLFEEHSEATLRAWARRLHLFRFVRAYGGHANDGDQLLAVYAYSGVDELEEMLERLGIAVVRFAEPPARPVAGVAYSADEFATYPALIPDTAWVAQPGHCTVAERRAFVWCGRERLSISLSDGYRVTDEQVGAAETIERLLRTLPAAPVDPPVDDEHCICPRYYPDYFAEPRGQSA